MMLVTIQIGGDKAEVRFAFNPVAVKCVREVPGRQYQPEGKFWSIPANAVTHLEALLRHEGFDVEVLGGKTTGDWVEALMKRIGCDKAMYRKLSVVFHPDTGGNGRMQQELNDGYKRCCGRR